MSTRRALASKGFTFPAAAKGRLLICRKSGFEEGALITKATATGAEIRGDFKRIKEKSRALIIGQEGGKVYLTEAIFAAAGMERRSIRKVGARKGVTGRQGTAAITALAAAIENIALSTARVPKRFKGSKATALVEGGLGRALALAARGVKALSITVEHSGGAACTGSISGTRT